VPLKTAPGAWPGSDRLDDPAIFVLGYALTWKENFMNVTKLARIVGLSLILSVTSLAAFADPPAQQPCGCSYCSNVPAKRNCTNFDGTTTTCGYFLAVTLCQPQG
jgi:hypothetical protein